ncbi:putative MarR family transcription regulator [Aestuariispira insulae]|uniref:Putative MarR family transcription regulator n=2 Tax=Aestuariispira insulae TaxID=1461337 RepID=A0A3D9HJL9_9PROT|nr:putative MarR family transcription regulator [Aestuariispira insulae]
MTDRPSKERIVSSAHLVSEDAAELSEYEFGLIIASNAFNRWITRCMTASGGGDLSPLEVLVLHTVNHRSREKRLADICFTLNVEDTHTVNYALKKLLKNGLVEREKKGKEQFYRATIAGSDACANYRKVREACLVDAFGALGGLNLEDVGEMAKTLRALSGLYDQAARSATSL